MKRILCLLIAISMVLAMASCQEKEEKIVCEECGTSILQSSNYCSNCGTNILNSLTVEERRFVGTYEKSSSQYFYHRKSYLIIGGGYSTTDTTITSTSIPVNEKMVLNEDGTGTFERRFADNTITEKEYIRMVDKFDLKKDGLHSTYNVEWKAVGGYVVIQFSGYNYYPRSSDGETKYETVYVSDGELDEFSKTYELKGNKMFEIDGTSDKAQFTKID